VDWYYERNREQVGPVEEGEFQILVAQGVITPQTLVWHAGMTDWQPLSQVEMQAAAAADYAPQSPHAAPLYGDTSEQSAYPCAECGRLSPAQDVVEYEGRYICAQCKPLFFQRLREGAPIGFIYAGFWIRVVAVVVDWFLLFIGQLLIMAVMSIALFAGDGSEEFVLAWSAFMQLVQIAWVVSYETWFIGRFGATPGKMAVGIKVVRADGSRVTYLRAFARYFAKALSGLILGIGYLMAAFDEEKRGLHDHICDTRVVRK
jgi:uncharacterized RDD family membrane protein YckC